MSARHCTNLCTVNEDINYSNFTCIPGIVIGPSNQELLYGSGVVAPSAIKGAFGE